MSLFHKILSLPVWGHTLLATGAFVAMQAAQSWLDAYYAASRHPVDYATGQTSFDGPTIKGYYASMQGDGTLGIYLQTQIIDFAFILAVALTGLFLGTLVARAGRAGSWARRLGFAAAAAALLGALSDALENAVSFVMLANPQGFADWLALPYSGFAVVKFALLTLAMALLLVSLILTVLGRATGKPTLG